MGIAGHGMLVGAPLLTLVGIAGAWGHVLAIRFADRIGKGVRTSPRDALVAASVPADDRGRAFGLQRAMDHLGAVLGPLAAFLLMAGAGLSYRPVFILSAVVGSAGKRHKIIKTKQNKIFIVTPQRQGISKAASFAHALRKRLCVSSSVTGAAASGARMIVA